MKDAIMHELKDHAPFTVLGAMLGVVFQMIREALVNAIKHGNPDTAGMADPAIETRMQNEVLPLLNPTAQNLHERKRLIRSLFAPTENAVFFTSLATDELKNRVADNKNQCFSAYADLMRLESNFVIGKCTRFNNHMADILL